MVYLTMVGFGVQPLVLGPTVDNYVKYNQFEHFSLRKCHHFEQMAHTLWSLLVEYNTLKGFPNVPC